MTERGSSARAMLDAWREQGADRLDAMRFRFMDALEQRASMHEGEPRRLLDEKLSSLLAAYACDLEAASPKRAPTPGHESSSALSGLIGDLAGNTSSAGGKTSSFPELETLDAFRRIWSSLRTERQLRQSLEHAPTNAGPLNSAALVARSITLMRDVSPGYLQHFLAYVDDLAWMEQLQATRAFTGSDTAPAVATKKRARKPRTRRE